MHRRTRVAIHNVNSSSQSCAKDANVSHVWDREEQKRQTVVAASALLLKGTRKTVEDGIGVQAWPVVVMYNVTRVK